jgi:hypothetical protein
MKAFREKPEPLLSVTKDVEARPLPQAIEPVKLQQVTIVTIMFLFTSVSGRRCPSLTELDILVTEG